MKTLIIIKNHIPRELITNILSLTLKKSNLEVTSTNIIMTIIKLIKKIERVVDQSKIRKQDRPR